MNPGGKFSRLSPARPLLGFRAFHRSTKIYWAFHSPTTNHPPPNKCMSSGNSGSVKSPTHAAVHSVPRKRLESPATTGYTRVEVGSTADLCHQENQHLLRSVLIIFPGSQESGEKKIFVRREEQSISKMRLNCGKRGRGPGCKHLITSLTAAHENGSLVELQ